ncbi:hypothetical protein [Rossellomorea sp. KS-H15a]|nr:hypothetical protein [Rossellomorea sp. KS-H15a]
MKPKKAKQKGSMIKHLLISKPSGLQLNCLYYICDNGFTRRTDMS